ncbi:peptidylprolyl isomerase [Sneathia sanguinegens]|uniref:peptidylprolyl isomerase n=1 Tax=Sneathia sanguinegens TaxID=40543 RepID=UPI002914F34C|nr:peptidylprolyl isomerase [Sneathia sanguinegens]MDU7496471.1 peptidylprolyl isomerase [Sneathia sanguinegens]
MALRKFSKYMKIMTILIIVSAVLSAGFAGYQYLTAYFHNRKEVLCVINGEKVYKQDYENEYKNIKENIENVYRQYGREKNKDFIKVPDKVVKEMAMASITNSTLSKVLAHNLKIEVSSVDVNAKMTEIENKYGGKETLSLLLAQKGATIADLKANIKDSLIAQKTIEKFKEKIRPTDKQLADLYNRFKYTEFDSRQFSEVKDQVEDMYYKQNLDYLLNSSVEELFNKATIKTKNKEIKELFDNIKKIEVQVSDVKVSRKDMLNMYVTLAVQSEKGYYSDLEAKTNEEQKKEIEKLIEKEKVANEHGIKGMAGVTPINRIHSALQNYYYYLVDTYKPSEEEMKAWFAKNKSRYDIKNTVAGEIFGKDYKTSEIDLKNTENKAKELMKTITKGNFASKAKENSDDTGTKKVGGELGWVDIDSLVKEFRVVEGKKAGTIVGPIKTVYGYHIVLVEDVDAKNSKRVKLRHILLKPINSEDTKNKVNKEVADIENQIKTGKLTWEQITTDKTQKYSEFNIREQFSLIERNSALPKVGYSKELMDELFKIKVGEFLEKDLGNCFVIIQKTQEIPYKEAKFEDLKDRIRVEMGFKYADSELGK